VIPPDRPAPTHTDGDALPCPFCSVAMENLREFSSGREHGATGIDCPACGKQIVVEWWTAMNYTARAL